MKRTIRTIALALALALLAGCSLPASSQPAPVSYTHLTLPTILRV